MSTSTGPSDVLTLSLAGQAMIRGDLRVDAPEAIADISALVQGDVAFTNFEAAVFDPTRGQGYRDGRFVSPPETIELLASVGFNVLSLANNHAFDMGAAGILNTVETADRLHLAHSGAGRTLAEAAGFCVVETANARVAVLSVASGLVSDARASASSPGLNELGVVGDQVDGDDARRVLDTIKVAKDAADLVVVSHHNHHYPGVERPADFKQMLLSQLPARLAPPAWLERWARQLVEAGADVVAMHGPPLAHGIEVYQGKPIFYSLGNFIFQVPPESIQLEEPIMWESVVAEVDFVGDRAVAVRLTPIAMNKLGRGLPNPHDQFDVNEFHRTRGLPRRATGAQARFLLERVAEFSSRYGTTIAVDGDVARVDLGGPR